MEINTLLRGALAGCVATAPMTLVMQMLYRTLPRQEQYALPPSEITQTITHKAGVDQQIEQDQHVALTLLAHFGYGAATGAVYASLASWLPFGAASNGIMYGLGVWTVSYLGLLPAAGLLTPATEHPTRRNALMIAAHVIWGAVTGVLVERLQGRDKSK
jgi:uncharacterized membrane protein YagU involved in acid resistance